MKIKEKSILFVLLIVVSVIVSVCELYSQHLGQDQINNLSNLPRLISVDDKELNDLSFLDSILTNKRIVLLGESSHGINEYSKIKLRLISYLHEKHHFNVVCFESGISELAYLNERKDSILPKTLLEKGLFDIWHTDANVGLMNYIKDNQLQMAGMDNQYTSNQYSEYIKSTGNAINPQQAEVIYSIDTSLSALFLNSAIYIAKPNETKNKFINLSLKANTSYREFMHSIDSSLISNQNHSIYKKRSYLLLKQILKNKLHYINCITQGNEYFQERDSVMGNNFKFLLDSIYANSKVIVWAHNSHISKTGLQNPTSYFGRIIQKQYRDKIYGIGLYAYEGELMENSRRGIIHISKPESNHLEYRLHQLRNNVISEDKALFLNLQYIKPTFQTNWLMESLPALGWGNTPIVPTQEYDGLILIEKAHIPTYID